MFYDKETFDALAEELSSVKCPDCGGTHKVTFQFSRGVIVYSTVEGCPGFNELVNNRLSTL